MLDNSSVLAIDKESFHEWKNHSVTKVLYKLIARQRELIINSILSLEFNNDSKLKPAEQHFMKLGILEGLKVLEKIEFYQVENKKE